MSNIQNVRVCTGVFASMLRSPIPMKTTIFHPMFPTIPAVPTSSISRTLTLHYNPFLNSVSYDCLFMKLHFLFIILSTPSLHPPPTRQHKVGHLGNGALGLLLAQQSFLT